MVLFTHQFRYMYVLRGPLFRPYVLEKTKICRNGVSRVPDYGYALEIENRHNVVG